MIHALNKIVDWVENIMVVILMLVATVVAIVQVVARYVFNNSLYWSEELILYSLITMSFLAASMGVRYAAHISVEMLYAFAGPRLTRVLKYVATLLGFAFAATLVYYDAGPRGVHLPDDSGCRRLHAGSLSPDLPDPGGRQGLQAPRDHHERDLRKGTQ